MKAWPERGQPILEFVAAHVPRPAPCLRWFAPRSAEMSRRILERAAG